MIVVPHDQPSRLMRSARRCLRIHSAGRRPYGRGDDRLVRLGRLGHFGRTRGPAVAAQIDQIHVEAAAGDVVHPGEAVEREIEPGLGRIGGTVHEQQDALGRESAHVRRALAAQVQLDAWRVGGDGQLSVTSTRAAAWALARPHSPRPRPPRASWRR
jgi:hypothetical protein